MTKTIFGAVFLGVFGFALAGCSTTPPTEEKREKLDNNVSSTLSDMRAESPDFGEFLDKAYGYAIYPTVGEGAFLFGVAGGRGEVYEQGKMIGYSEMQKGTFGAQIGGKAYAQVIVFENKRALDKFLSKDFQFSAEVSAVAIKSGAAKMAKFQDGIAVFQYQKGGLMATAAVGGQRFTYSPLR